MKKLAKAFIIGFGITIISSVAVYASDYQDISTFRSEFYRPSGPDGVGQAIPGGPSSSISIPGPWGWMLNR